MSTFRRFESESREMIAFEQRVKGPWWLAQEGDISWEEMSLILLGASLFSDSYEVRDASAFLRWICRELEG